MSSRVDIDVVICGEQFTISGFESREHIHKIEDYINNKFAECSRTDTFKRQSSNLRDLSLLINIADDYFKAKDRIDSLEDSLQIKEDQLFDLKQKLITAQMKLENLDHK